MHACALNIEGVIDPNIYIHMYTHENQIHVYIYIYSDICVYIFVCVWNQVDWNYIQSWEVHYRKNIASNQLTWTVCVHFCGNFRRTGIHLGRATGILLILWGLHLIAFTSRAINSFIHLPGNLLLPWHL